MLNQHASVTNGLIFLRKDSDTSAAQIEKLNKMTGLAAGARPASQERAGLWTMWKT
jgi:hypothetical protein